MQIRTIKRSIAFFVVTLSLCIPNARAASPGADMAAAANHFLAALTPEQKAKAVIELKSDERMNWHFIPKNDRKGLEVKEMTPGQRNLAHALLSSGMSQRGYGKAVTIMSLEEILHEQEKGNPKAPIRDSERYYFSIFGTPSATGTWGWRVEGHHFSQNFTIVNGKDISNTPSFMGTNPAKVLEGSRKGLQVLGTEENLARELVKSLNAEQKKSAIYTNVAPKDIITMAERKVSALATTGLPAAKMTKEQNEMLMKVISEYVNRVRPDLAKTDMEAIQKAGIDKVYFAWGGSVEVGEGHYYRVQGPTFLLEYDNTQNNANHVHAVWRDFAGDFGEDILAKHLKEAH
jgi:hypothetical protein